MPILMTGVRCVMMYRDRIALAAFILVCFGAAAIGSWFTTPSLESWYVNLRKPAWNPPNWVFAPVWSVLYLAMAVAAWLVWRRAGFGGAPVALGLFGVQLILNVSWSWLFFGLHNPPLAFAGIVALWVAIAATTIAFARINTLAAWIMTPYLAWVTFAAGLNLTIWRLNSIRLGAS